MTKKQNSISRVFLSNNNISPTKNMIICGDSTNESTYKKLFSSKIDDKSFNLADALITDPPYCKRFY